MTETEMIKALSAMIDSSKFPYQLPNVFIYGHECDYWVMDQDGNTREFEIKISRSDFLVDRKKDKHQKTGSGANYFYYVVPAGLIKPDEIPPKYGLVYIKGEEYPYCASLEKKPRRLHDQLFTDWKMLANKMYWRWYNLWRDKLLNKEITRQQFYEGHSDWILQEETQ